MTEMTETEFKSNLMEMAYADGFTAYEIGIPESNASLYSSYKNINALWKEGYIEAENIQMSSSENTK